MEHDTLAINELALVLASAFIGGAVLQRFRQPVLVGYVLVGLLIGPSGLGLISSHDNVSLLAELGILLLLFVIGLELDLHRFMPVYKVAVTVTVLQILFGLLTMSVLGWAFDWPIARIVLLGFAFSLSSTAVALKLLEDTGELHKPLGRMTIGILIAQDIAIIPMLLIIGMLRGEPAGIWDFARLFMAIGLFVGVSLFLMRQDQWMAPLRKSKLAKSLHLWEAGFGRQKIVIALAICFLAASFSGALGFSTAYGAFLAGLIIGNLGDDRSIEEEVRPVFELLMMVFFLSIGLLIDLDFIGEHLLGIIGLLFITLIFKTAFNTFVLRMMGLSVRHTVIMGAVLGQVGEFSFVLAALGLSVGAIYDEGYKFVVAIIALSLIMTPLWLYTVRRLRLFGVRTFRRDTARKRNGS